MKFVENHPSVGHELLKQTTANFVFSFVSVPNPQVSNKGFAEILNRPARGRVPAPSPSFVAYFPNPIF